MWSPSLERSCIFTLSESGVEGDSAFGIQTWLVNSTIIGGFVGRVVIYGEQLEARYIDKLEVGVEQVNLTGRTRFAFNNLKGISWEDKG